MHKKPKQRLNNSNKIIDKFYSYNKFGGPKTRKKNIEKIKMLNGFYDLLTKAKKFSGVHPISSFHTSVVIKIKIVDFTLNQNP